MSKNLLRKDDFDAAVHDGRAGRLLNKPALRNPFTRARFGDNYSLEELSALWCAWGSGWTAEDNALRHAGV
jgi:hypothetical protein